MVHGCRRTSASLFLALFDLLLFHAGFGFTYGLNFTPWLSLIFLAAFYLFDLYTDWRRKSIFNLVITIVLAVFTYSVFSLLLTFWFPLYPSPSQIIYTASLSQIGLLSISRSVIWLVNKMFFGRKRVLIIGEDAAGCLATAAKVQQHANGWFIVHGILPSGRKHELLEKLQSVDIVLLNSNVPDKSEMVRCCIKNGKEVLIVPTPIDLCVMGCEPQQVDDMLVLSVKPPNIGIGQRFVKRLLDVLVSVCLLLVLSPIMVILCLLIPLGSAGATIYKQERVGMKEKKFHIYKFRSMIQDAENDTGPVLAADGDPRITIIGRFMRATRLDELPQLINVLKGDMSLVGPRPERAVFIEQFKAILPDYEYRFLIKPGITGLAQVMGKYSTTVENKLRMDLMYIQYYSFWTDLKILLQTIRVVLLKGQAEGTKVIDQLQADTLQVRN